MDNDDRTTSISARTLGMLLDLASQSPDLTARASLRWDDKDPLWGELGPRFRQKVLDDLSARDDLSVAECERVIEALVDEDDLDDEEFALDAQTSVALVRAWLSSGRPAQGRWLRRVLWESIPSRDARDLLAKSAEYRMTAALMGFDSGRDIALLANDILPRAFNDAVERLEWFDMHVVQRADEGSVGEALEFVADLVWSWYDEVPSGDLRARMRALRAIASIARRGAVDGSDEIGSAVDDAWRAMPWKRASRADLEVILREETPGSVAEAQRGSPHGLQIAQLVGSVAPLVYPDLADRLQWFVEAVGKPAGDTRKFDEPINTALTEYVCEWLEELRDHPVEEIVVVLRAMRRVPMAACIHQPDLDEAIETLREKLRTSVDED